MPRTFTVYVCPVCGTWDQEEHYTGGHDWDVDPECHRNRRVAVQTVSIEALLSDLRDENGLFDTAIGSAINAQRTVGGGIVATARAVRLGLAEYFTTVASEETR